MSLPVLLVVVSPPIPRCRRRPLPSTGPAGGAIGAQNTLIAAGLLGAVVTFSALLLPGMREVEGLEGPVAEDEPVDEDEPAPSPELVAA